MLGIREGQWKSIVNGLHAATRIAKIAIFYRGKWVEINEIMPILLHYFKPPSKKKEK